MASYASYKKIINENIVDGSISNTAISTNALCTWNVKWFYGNPDVCSPGCCCLWTVPDGVYSLFWEAWGAGGSGHGACSCNRCHHQQGAGGGAYASKWVTTAPGCQYTVCAGGNSNCCRFECTGCFGCTSYVTGYNLSNFCAIGGNPGCANTDWSTACFSEWACCLAPTANGSDFTLTNHRGSFRSNGMGDCWCWCQVSHTTGAPFLGADVVYQLNCCWMRCGCWTVPYGAGGQGAIHGLCGTSCCGQGGMGGPGLVKVTYF